MLPKDPVILLSYINTMLRDNYPSFEELCKSLNVSSEQITSVLSQIDYTYDKDLNRFV